MPGSLRDYAVDYDHDGKIDLAGDVDDAVGSVANYLACTAGEGDRSWKPVAIEIDKQDDVERALDGGISDRRTHGKFAGSARVSMFAGIPENAERGLGGILMLEDEAGHRGYLGRIQQLVLTDPLQTAALVTRPPCGSWLRRSAGLRRELESDVTGPLVHRSGARNQARQHRANSLQSNATIRQLNYQYRQPWTP